MVKSGLFTRPAALMSCIVALVSLLIFAAVSQAAALPAVGAIHEIRSGTISVQKDGSWHPAAVGDIIFSHDRVRTDASGTAVLRLDKIGKFLIGPNTEYTVGEDSKNFKTILHRGYVWFKSAFVSGARVEISSGNAVAGTRGTKFSVLSDSEGVEVCTCKGAVDAGTADGKGVIVGKGMYAVVLKNGIVSSPAKGTTLIDKVWQEKTGRYTPCLLCHVKGKKPLDL